MDSNPIQPTIKDLLVKVWTVAAANPGYDESSWRQLQGALVRAGIKPLAITDDDIKARAVAEIPKIRDGIRGLLYIHAEIELPEVQALRALPYKEYLKSPHWAAVRDRCVAEADGKCRMCGNKKRIVAHHRSYDFLGCEERQDVVAICGQCHDKHHTAGKRNRRLFTRKKRGDYHALTRQSDI